MGYQCLRRASWRRSHRSPHVPNHKKAPYGTYQDRQVLSKLRSCIIPYGKALLLTPIDVECSFAENPTLKTETDLRSCAKSDQDQVNSLNVDGISLSNVSKYRVASPLFNLTLPENNNLGLDPQVTQAVSDGYWIILEPLPKGNHTITSSGAIIEPTGVYSFVSDVTWKINIR